MNNLVSKNPLRNPYNLTANDLRKRYNRTTPVFILNNGCTYSLEKDSFKNIFNAHYPDANFAKEYLGNFSFVKKNPFHTNDGDIVYLGDIPTTHPYINVNTLTFSVEDVLYIIPEWVYTYYNHVYITTVPLTNCHELTSMSKRHLARTYVWARKTHNYNLRKRDNLAQTMEQNL